MIVLKYLAKNVNKILFIKIIIHIYMDVNVKKYKKINKSKINSKKITIIKYINHPVFRLILKLLLNKNIIINYKILLIKDNIVDLKINLIRSLSNIQIYNSLLNLFMIQKIKKINKISIKSKEYFKLIKMESSFLWIHLLLEHKLIKKIEFYGKKKVKCLD